MKITENDVRAAVARIMAEGVPAALKRTGARMGRFVLRIGGTTKDTSTDIPSKLVVAEASGQDVRTFSGGFARTVGILVRLGFVVIDTKTGRPADSKNDGRTR